MEHVKEEKNPKKKERKKLKDSFAKQLIFCVSILAVFFVIDKVCINAIENNKYEKDVIEREEVISQNMIYEIEKLEYGIEDISITGWVAWNDVEWENVAIVLQAEDSSEVVVSKAELVERQDVKGCFNSMKNVKSMGFTTSISTKKLKDNVCYEVLVDVSYKTTAESGTVIRSGIKMTTHRYLYDGIEYTYNPLQFVEPNINSEEWKNIFENARLCDYSMEHGTWIYIYEGVLYVIIDSRKVPPIEKVLSVPIEMYTSRGDLVPESQLERYTKRGHTYAEIYLNESHYLDEEKKDYFVVSYELPTDYPILYIYTGLYGNRDGVSFVYRANFRLHTLEKLKQWN